MNGRPDKDFLREFGIIAIVSYFFIAQYLMASGGGWSPSLDLNRFTKGDPEGTRYVLRITAINDAPLETPVYFSDAADLLSNKDIFEGKSLINQLGNALHNENLADVDKYRVALETAYFGNFDTAEYEIIFLTVNPVERYNLESFTLERVLSQFRYTTKQATAASHQST